MQVIKGTSNLEVNKIWKKVEETTRIQFGLVNSSYGVCLGLLK